MKRLLFIYIFFFAAFISFAQSKDKNYVKSTAYFTEDQSKSITSVAYYDANGKPLQDIVIDASPSGKDIVQQYEYDYLNRVVKSYLPFTNNGENGDFLEDARDLQETFWQNQNISGEHDITYSEFIYDNSPYNQIIEQSTPGEDIENISFGSEYVPAGSEVEYWYVNQNNELIHDGNYQENSLIKYTIKDSENKETYIFKDKSGKVLLKEKTFKENPVKTRYVYDAYGRLRYVMSPLAVQRMNDVSYTRNSGKVKKLCYYYEYNDEHQLITKQLPGKEPIFYRYDSKKRLRMTQDGNQRDNKLWFYINYDRFGRTISTGIGDLDDDPAVFEDSVIEPAPVKGITAYLSYQYYDNYEFLNDKPNLEFDEQESYEASYSLQIRGLPTGSEERVMAENEEIWLASVVYYDQYGRVIQSISENNAGGYDIISNKYNFAGELLESKQKHTAFKFDAKYMIYYYEYDHAGRLKEIKLSRNKNGSGKQIIQRKHYDETGNIAYNQIHSEDDTHFLQGVNYTYNIKGALTQINDPDDLNLHGENDLFGLKLYYDEQLRIDEVSNTPNEDGRISAIQWNSTNLNEVQTYLYTYDDLNRLESATYLPSNKYDVFYKYDLNGNITNLLRNGQLIQKSKKDEIGAEPSTEFYYGAIDNLSYSYAGNQLSTVKDEVGEIETELNNDFRELKNDSETEYSYDKNGNMIADMNKGMKIKYNHLNQPTLVDLGNKRIEYLYTASGGMLQSTTYIESKKDNTTDYAGAFVYQNNSLSYINIPGGRITQRIEKAVLIEKYEYHLTDHLGNVRVTFAADNMGNAEILQEDHYYPFGLRMSGMHYSNTELLNKFLYNGKELQEQTGWYDYGFRQMDPQLGRWHVADAMAESYMSHSPYAYTMNDPVNYTDLLGLKAMSQLAEDDPLAMAMSGHSEYVEGAGWQWFSDHTMGISSDNSTGMIDRHVGMVCIDGVWINKSEIETYEGDDAKDYYEDKVLDNGKGRKQRSSARTTAIEVGEAEVLINDEGAFATEDDFSTGDPPGKPVKGKETNQNSTDINFYAQGDAYLTLGAQGGWGGNFINLNSKELFGFFSNTQEGVWEYDFRDDKSYHKIRNQASWNSGIFNVGIKRTAGYYMLQNLTNEYELALSAGIWKLETNFSNNGKILNQFIGIDFGTNAAAILGLNTELKIGFKIKY
jgi:RHS repeat-associated protein